jgi:hypothetical protein
VGAAREREASDRRLECLADLLGRPRVVHRTNAHGDRVGVRKPDRRVHTALVHLDLNVVHRLGTTDRLLAVHAEAAVLEDVTTITNAALELGVGDIVDPVADPLHWIAGNHDEVVLEEL